MTEAEMMADLAAADSAGDTALAQHIAGKIKAQRAAQPTKTESALRGAAQGTTLGFGDEAQGAIQALGIKALGQTGAERPFAQLYKENRDAMRRENAAAKTANPWSYGLGQVAGGAPLALATGGGGVARLIGTGAALGGATGLGESTADTLGGQVWDATKGAAIGAAIPTAVVGLGKAAPMAANALRSGAIGTARRILVNKTGSLSAASANSMNPSGPGVFTTAAEQVAAKPTTGGRLGLSQGEQLKRSLQGMAKAAYQQQQPAELGQAQEAAAAMMREAIEKEVAQQAPGVGPVAQEAAAAFEPVKERLSHLIAAGKVADQGMNRATNRHAFSLRDALAASGGMAHGGPIGAVGGGIASHVLGSRGASTAASAMNAGANALDWLTNPALTPAQARMQALIEALRTRALPLAAEEAGGRTSR
jgi:hypothetical protein